MKCDVLNRVEIHGSTSRLRDGKITHEDWEFVQNHCAEQNMTEERRNEFLSDYYVIRY
jgi:hypothetical protein